jgi:hypothetical protein
VKSEIDRAISISWNPSPTFVFKYRPSLMSPCLMIDHSGCLRLRAAAQGFHPSRHSTLG